jgi:hypothetical protein
VFWYINDWLYRNRTNPDFKNPLPAHADEYVRQDKHLKAGEPLTAYSPYVPLHFFCPQCGKEMRSGNEVASAISHLNSSLLVFFKMLVVVGLIFFIFYIIEGSKNGVYSDYYSFLWTSVGTLIIGIVGAFMLNDVSSPRSK